MRNLILFLAVLFVFVSCDKPGDCVKSSGKMAVRTIDTLAFKKIIVHKGIALVITQGDAYKIEIRTGENLVNDIEVKLNGDLLSLEDNTTCNWTREYGETTVYITAPDLTDIYSKTEKSISSNGQLTYNTLRIVSMDSEDGFSGTGTGDYYLEINNANLMAECNNVSRFFITGQTQNLTVNFYEGGGIFKGADFPAEKVTVYHRGSNDIYVNPIAEITAELYSIGNIFATSRPPIVRVNEHYYGRMIFD